MKKFFPIVILLIFASCTVNKAPEFINVDHVEVETQSLNDIEISGNINFHNPNDVGCEFVKMDLDVFANGVNIGKAKESAMSKIDRNDDFYIPATINVSPKEIFGGNVGGLIGGAIAAITKKEIDVEFKGTVTLKKLGMNFDIDVDEKQTVQLNDKSSEENL